MKIGAIDYGVASWMFPGHSCSGDQYSVNSSAGEIRFVVADGLGHGEEAALAAGVAMDTAQRYADESLTMLVQRCHEHLRETRGVVMSLAVIDFRDRTLTWMGIGNVAGLLVRAGRPSEELLLRGGVVGAHLPSLQPARLPVGVGDTLILATDGIEGAFVTGVSTTEPPQAQADRLLAQFRKGSDDALVLVARFTGEGASWNHSLMILRNSTSVPYSTFSSTAGRPNSSRRMSWGGRGWHTGWAW